MNPLLGVFFHWLGGLAAGSFYVPFRGVKRWSWETAWLVAGVFSWIIAPWTFALINTRDVLQVLRETPGETWFYTYLFGALWGMGTLTFGLSMRYLGISLGMAVALGYCTVFGTLIPPIFKGEFVAKLIEPVGGRWVLGGLLVCVAGIAINAFAGHAKESGMDDEQKRKTVKEFNFRKGLLVATFSGIMSACFAFGLSAGSKIGEISAAHGTDTIWTGLPVLIVILAGGFTSNVIWCGILNIRNRSGYEYAATESRTPDKDTGERRIPLTRNYAFAALAGVTWYFQFFFYSMGETQMGEYGFSSWTLHMASIIIFSSIWGLCLGEWRGSGPKAKRLLFTGLTILILSTIVIGYGNYIGGRSGH